MMVQGPNVMDLMAECLNNLTAKGVTEIQRDVLVFEIRDKLTHLPPRARISQAFHIVSRFAHRFEEWHWTRNARHVEVLRRR